MVSLERGFQRVSKLMRTRSGQVALEQEAAWKMEETWRCWEQERLQPIAVLVRLIQRWDSEAVVVIDHLFYPLALRD